MMILKVESRKIMAAVGILAGIVILGSILYAGTVCSANRFDEDEIAEMVESSKFVGTVKILELENEGKTHNGNVYRCSVEKLMKGRNLNTYKDGTILITIKKDMVDIGSIYIIGFSPVDSESLIYVQATVGSVYAVNHKLVKRVSKLIEDPF